MSSVLEESLGVVVALIDHSGSDKDTFGNSDSIVKWTSLLCTSCKHCYDIMLSFEQMRSCYRELTKALKDFLEKLDIESNHSAKEKAAAHKIVSDFLVEVDRGYLETRLYLYNLIISRGKSDEQMVSREVFFFNTPLTLQAIDRRYRKISIYFNVLKGTEEEKPLISQIMIMLNNAVEYKRKSVFNEFSMVETLTAVYSDFETHMVVISFLQGSGTDAELRKRGLEPDQLQQTSALQYRENVLKPCAQEAAELLHPLIQIISKRYNLGGGDIDKWFMIDYRHKIALCYLFLNLLADAQLYLIGALHVAHLLHHDFTSPTGHTKPQIKETLEQTLRLVKELICPPERQRVAAVPAQTVWKVQTFENQNDVDNRDPTKHHRKHPAVWLSLHTYRADSTVVKYVASQSEIEAANTAAVIRFRSGVAVAATATLVPITAVSAAAAIALTPVMVVAAANPFSLMAIGASLVITSIFGIFYASKGLKMMREPKLRRSLNENIMKVAMELFANGDLNGCFETLAKPYGKHRGSSGKEEELRLFTFDRAQRLRIDPTLIIVNLHGHGFRPDGIAYILNIIAEVLTSSQILNPGTENTESHLRSEAQGIYSVIINSNLLLEEAYRLDNLIIDHSLASRMREMFLRTAFGAGEAMINGIPESYYHDEEVAPFAARLEEMRNSARMNSAILELIAGSADNIVNAATFMKAVERSPNSQFRYFSMSEHRLNTIADFVSAFGVISDDEAPIASPVPAADPFKVSALRIAGCVVGVTKGRAIKSDSSIIDLLGDLGFPITYNAFYLRLGQYLEEDTRSRTHYYSVGDRVITFVDDPSPTFVDAKNLLEFKKTPEPLIEDLKRYFLAKRYLQQRFFGLLEHIFGIKIIRCRMDDNQNEFVPVDLPGALRDLTAVVFLFASLNTAVSDHEPVLAFLAENLPPTTAKETCTFSALMQNAQVAYDDFLRARKESDRKSLLAKCGTCARSAVSQEVSLQGYWVVSNVISPEICEAILFYIQCRIAQMKLENADHLLYKFRSRLDKYWKYWYLLSVLRQKQGEYRCALVYVNRAVMALSDHIIPVSEDEKRLILTNTLGRHRDICQRLNDKSQQVLAKTPAPTAPAPSTATIPPAAPVPPASVLHDHVEKLYKYSPGNENFRTSGEYYNVLSLDGGGIKGIIPAVFLAEVEKRARAPISSLVQHIAGTSTGSIIGAALSVRSTPQSQRPKFTAYEVLEMYSDPAKADAIFHKTYNIWGLFGSKYSAEGRAAAVKEYLGDAKLGSALTNLTICAFNQTVQLSTTFTKQKNPDLLLTDAALASSAAPTFFPSHQIGDTHYIDGGLSMNNPAMAAYEDALQLKEDKQLVRVWSIGCGDYLSDYFSHNHGAIYHAAHVPAQMINAGMGAVDDYLCNQLGANYDRWQLWMPKDTPMDDTREATLLTYVELAKQFIEEEDASDSNRINVMVERLTQ